MAELFSIGGRIDRTAQAVATLVDRLRAGLSPVELTETAVRLAREIQTKGVSGASTPLLRRAIAFALQAPAVNGLPYVADGLDEIHSNLQGRVTDAELNRDNLYSPDGPYLGLNGKDAKVRFNLRDLNKRSNSRDLNAMFQAEKVKLSRLPSAGKRPTKYIESDPVAEGLFLQSGGSPRGQISMRFEEESSFGDDGYILTDNRSKKPSDVIPDDRAYVPLSFTDLRPLDDSHDLRTVYFRPIITNLSQDLVPEWNKRSTYGRSDQVVTYISTLRSIFIGFELHAFYPDDLETIHRKLFWLESMVYPEYDAELLLKAGPVCRMRVGDVFATRNGLGLPGVIDSLNFDYSDSIWEVEKDKKAPRSVRVSLSFHVLHDTPIGRRGGRFGGIGYLGPRGEFTKVRPEPNTQIDAISGGSIGEGTIASPGHYKKLGGK